MIFKRPVYIFSKITEVHVTDDPNEASRWYVAESKDTTDPVVAWCIEGHGKPKEIDPSMLLNHMVMDDKRNDIVKTHLKRKKGGRRPFRFKEIDITRVAETIEKYGFNKAAKELEVSKSTLYHFRKRMKDQGLWNKNLIEKL